LKLTVDRGPNWLFVKLHTRRNWTHELPHLADELWSIAERHFIYRLLLELEELRSIPTGLIEQLLMLNERLADSGGALRISGLTAKCARALRGAGLDAAALEQHAQESGIHGDSVILLREKLKQAISADASKN
jgi:hypothetical protein